MKSVNIGSGFIVALTPLLLAVPIALINYGSTGIVLADIVCIYGLVVFLKFCRTEEAFLLMSSISISVIFILVISGVNYIYVLGSMIFFFKPCFAYFAGMYYSGKVNNKKTFFDKFNIILFLQLISIIYSIYCIGDGVVRADSSINGSIFGVSMFGSYGVNSLAIFFSMCVYIALFSLVESFDKKLKILFAITMLGYGYLTIMSLSRAAIIGVIIMTFSICYAKYAHHLLKFLSFIFASVVIVLLMANTMENSGIFEAKIEQLINGIADNNFDSISSGRFTLYIAAFDDILKNPIVGTAFQGFTSTRNSIEGFDDLNGLSPHNQYITAIWKMGPLAAFFYFIMLAIMVGKAYWYSVLTERQWLVGFLIGVLFVFGNTWDILIVPNVAALFFFILGFFAFKKRVDHAC